MDKSSDRDDQRNGFTLGPPLTVKGLVTDADTGEPVAAFKITPGWPEGDGARFERQRASTGIGRPLRSPF